MSGFNIEMMRSQIGGANLERLSEGSKIGKTDASGDTGFNDTLKKMIEDVNQSELVADAKTQELSAGRSKDIHGTMLAMEKADIDFRLLTQVRNKVIDAYREIMRMQV